MDILKKQVRQARRRLIVQQFLRVVAWSLFSTLMIAALAVTVPKIWPIPFDTQIWTWSWLAGSLAVGLLVTVIWTIAVACTRIDAAVEIDRRYELRERVSSSLALNQTERESEMGRALVNDTARRVERIDVAEKFGVKGNWQSLLPVFPAAAVAFLILVVPDSARQPTSEAGAAPIIVNKQIRNSTEQLQKKLAARQEKAEEANLKELADLLKKLEAGVGDMSNKSDVGRKKAMAKLNDLAEELKRRRAQLGSGEQIRKQMNALRNIKKGPGDKMAKAIRDGNIGQALDELKELQKQLRNGNLTDQQQANLAQQLNQMAQKLQQMADAHEQAKRELEREIEQRMKRGDLAGAGKLQQKLDQLNRQNQQMNRLRQMAQKLGQCAQCIGDGESQDAAQQLDMLAMDLEQMQSELDELEMLEDAMDQFGQAKDSIRCGNCNGLGCSMCQGFGELDGGMGLGQGRGRGERPEAETDRSYYDSQVRAKIRRGKAVVVGSVPGRNIAGDAREQMKEAIESAKKDSDDPLIGQRIPRQHRDQVEQYFDAFREGEN